MAESVLASVPMETADQPHPRQIEEEDLYSHAMQVGVSMLESDLKKREEESSSTMDETSQHDATPQHAEIDDVDRSEEEDMDQSDETSDSGTDSNLPSSSNVKDTDLGLKESDQQQHPEVGDQTTESTRSEVSGETFNMSDVKIKVSGETFNMSDVKIKTEPVDLSYPDSASTSENISSVIDSVSAVKSFPYFPAAPLRVKARARDEIRCGQCSSVFKCLKSLQNHRRVKHPLKCEYCDKMYGSQHKLSSHIASVHEAAVSPTGARLFPCPLCGKCLSSASSRNKHLRLHAGGKPYSCEVCGKKYSQVAQLYSHMQKHSEAQPIACLYCPQLFTDKENAVQHTEAVHQAEAEEKAAEEKATEERDAEDKDCEEKPAEDQPVEEDLGNTEENKEKEKGKSRPTKSYYCKLCGKSLSERGSVRRHVRRIHTEVPEEMIPQLIVELENDGSIEHRTDIVIERTDHEVKREAFCCKICGKLYKDRSSVQRHLRKHHAIKHGEYSGLYTVLADDVHFSRATGNMAVPDPRLSQTAVLTDSSPLNEESERSLHRNSGSFNEELGTNGTMNAEKRKDQNELTNDRNSSDDDGEENSNDDNSDNIYNSGQTGAYQSSNWEATSKSGNPLVLRIKQEPKDVDDDLPTETLNSSSPFHPSKSHQSQEVDHQTGRRDETDSNIIRHTAINIKTEPCSPPTQFEPSMFGQSYSGSDSDSLDDTDNSDTEDEYSYGQNNEKKLKGGNSRSELENWDISQSNGSFSLQDDSQNEDGGCSDDSDKTIDFEMDNSTAGNPDMDFSNEDYSKDMARLDEELRRALMPPTVGLLPDAAMGSAVSNPQMSGGGQSVPVKGKRGHKTDGSRPTLRCNQCDKVYNNWKSYRQHRRSKHPLTCELCKKRFSEQKDFDAHMRGHYGLGTGKNYSCPVCGKYIKDASSRAKHMRLHTGEKPYKCEICDKRFTQTGHLQSHMRIHNGERPFDCKLCGKFFSERSSVKRHLRKIHFKDYNKKCEVCGVISSTKEEYRAHIQQHNPNIYSCEICMKDFPDSKRLKLHTYNAHAKMDGLASQTEYACQACDKVFYSPKGLRNHAKKHGETVESFFKCGICEKSFASSVKLEKHMITHVEKNYICLTCNKVFKTAAAFSIHKKKHLIAVLQKGENFEESAAAQIEVEEAVEKEGQELSMDQYQHNSNLEVDHMKANTSSKDLKVNLKPTSNSTGVSVLNPDSIIDYVVGGNIVDSAVDKPVDVAGQEDSNLDLTQSSKKSVVNVYHKTPSRQLTVHCCNVCGMYMTSKAHLRRHIEGVHGEKIHKCSDCNAVFASQELVRLHRKRAHRQTKTYQCNICTKHFKDKSVLRVHLRVHADVRPYTCEVCNKGFTAMYALKHHMEVHTGGSKKCPKCNTKFLHHRSYELHVKANCVGRRRRPKLPPVMGQIPGRTLRCQLCSYQFTYQASLTEHMQQEHNIGEDGMPLYSVLSEEDLKKKNAAAKMAEGGAEDVNGSGETGYEVLKQNFPSVFPIDEMGNMLGKDSTEMPDTDTGSLEDEDEEEEGSANMGANADYDNFEESGLDSGDWEGPNDGDEPETLMCVKCGITFEDAGQLAVHTEDGSCSRRRKSVPIRHVPTQNNDFLEHLDVNML